MQNTSLLPFLQLPFSEELPLNITEGWYYSSQEVELHGVALHHSVDFALPIGTPIYAAADGLAVASFTEVAVRNEDGTHRQWKGMPIYFGAGLVVKIFHENGLCTLYGHLHALAEDFDNNKAYYSPLKVKNGDLLSQNIKISPDELYSNVNNVSVKSGQLIGYSGITGMGWGQKTYENWLAGKPYEVCDEEHLHFQVLNSTADETNNYRSFDPFGLYQKADAYPKSLEDWGKLAHSLWL